MNSCSICKFRNAWHEVCVNCEETLEKPRGTQWWFDCGDEVFTHPCRVCARSKDNDEVESCEFPEYDGIFKGQACGYNNQYYKFIPLPQSKKVSEVDEVGDTGTAATSPHYNSLPVQPIELMEAMLTREEFLGFLKGNMIKYAMRAGRKDETKKDVNKYNQYKAFYEYVSQPEHSISDLVK